MPIANIIRDKLTRLLVAQKEPEYQALKLITKDRDLPLPIRLKAQLELQKFSRYARAVSVRNRCVIHGKTGGVLSAFKMNHMVFRERALAGQIPGVRKAIW